VGQTIAFCRLPAGVEDGRRQKTIARPTIPNPVYNQEMLAFAQSALEAATQPGISYADVRIVEASDRNLSTKNGRPGSITGSESIGAGIRVLANGCWGFAATDDLTPAGLQSAAALAIAIARSSAKAKKHDVVLAPEDKYVATWNSPCHIDPFSISVDEQLAYLLKVDAELRGNPGVTLSETSFHFERSRQVFASSIGSLIDQTRTVSGAGMVAYSFKEDEIQKRSYPNSFGGQLAARLRDR
jgi:TldD protein